VRIDDQTMLVGANLHSALLNLRYEDRERILWIDAICIDQTSPTERNQQVTIMGDIYKQSWRVLVWLRDADEEMTPKVMHMLAELATGALEMAGKEKHIQFGHGPRSDIDGGDDEEKRLKLCMLDNIPESMIERADIEDPLADKYRNDLSIMHLIGSQWWYRAWTLQEILLPGRAVAVVGQFTMDWWRFCAGTNHGFNIGIWAPITMGVIIDSMVLPYLSVQRLQERRASSGLGHTNDAQELLELLNSSRFRAASDPRDKIYALLGLADRGGAGTAPLGIVPDYTLPVADVYQRVAQQLIRVSGTLDVLGSAGPIADHTPEFDLPSWVPDWSYTKTVCSPLMHDALGRYRTTHATNGTSTNATFADSGRTLILIGHDVTTITALSPVLHRIVHRSDEFDGFIEDWIAKLPPEEDTFNRVTSLGGFVVQIIFIVYECLMAIVPHLGIYQDWETFASDVKPVDPDGSNNGRKASTTSWIKPGHSVSGLVARVNSKLKLLQTETISPPSALDGEPYDPLATYWHTLCTGTYVASQTTPSARVQNPESATEDKGPTRDFFYLWRASLKPIRDMHRWRVDRMFRPIAFIGYVRKTWRNYGDFVRLLEGAYERRLARGENGYLCLVPAAAEVGDKIVLAQGGRVPLVLRKGRGDDGSEGDWSFVGEAFVDGIMDGEAWAEEKAGPMRIR